MLGLEWIKEINDFDFEKDLNYAKYNSNNKIHKDKIKNRLLKKKCFFICYYCNCVVFRDKITLEHIIPISMGGRNTKRNCTLSCAECNNLRGVANRNSKLLNIFGQICFKEIEKKISLLKKIDNHRLFCQKIYFLLTNKLKLDRKQAIYATFYLERKYWNHKS